MDGPLTHRNAKEVSRGGGCKCYTTIQESTWFVETLRASKWVKRIQGDGTRGNTSAVVETCGFYDPMKGHVLERLEV